MSYRALMIRKMRPESAAEVARHFNAHDQTELPYELGATRRTLFRYHDLYLHLIEATDGFPDRLFAAQQRAEFQTIDNPLSRLLIPYRDGELSMRQAQAEPFYEWVANR